MFFNVAVVKIREKGITGKVVRGESFVEFNPAGRVLSQSGITEEAMAASDWEIQELND